ncbi:hypothetical protein DRW03_31530 [Corallococcus sp. H22C18031201]|nr:hypothetical protein DRW03_31530 [Corallococcus sp. H22C18031201]
MSSVRRLPSGIASPATRSIAEYEVTTPIRHEPPAPVPAVRHGFSDTSDFQAGEDDVAPLLEGHDVAGATDAGPSADGMGPPSTASHLMEHAQLRTLAGISDFESARPRYAQILGSPQPSTATPSPLPSFRPSAMPPREAFASELNPLDILSPEAAAWELQNLDTSTPTVDEPEDLLFMLEPPGTSDLDSLPMELGFDDLDADSGFDTGGTLDASGETPDFLADVNDVSAPESEFLATATDVAAPEHEPIAAEAAREAAAPMEPPVSVESAPETATEQTVAVMPSPLPEEAHAASVAETPPDANSHPVSTGAGDELTTREP